MSRPKTQVQGPKPFRSTPRPTSSMRSAGTTGAGKKRSASAAFLSDLRDLKVNDLIVHVDHGIGQFVGLKQISIAGGDIVQEFLELRYHGDAKLFVPGRAPRSDPEVHRRLEAAARSPRRHDLGEGQDQGQEGHARHGRGAAQALRRAQGGAGPRVRRRHALAGGVRGRVRVRPHAGPGHRDRRHQARHGIADADGPAALRRRRLRQDRSGDARRLQGGDGRQAGGVPRADHRAGRAAPEDADRTLRRVPREDRHGQPLPHQAGDQGDARGAGRPAASTSSSARTAAVEGRAASRTSACSSSTKSSASAWRTRSASSRCARRSTS